MLASKGADKYQLKLDEIGNATLNLVTDWGCTACIDVAGITLSKLVVETKNVTNPNMKAGFPSIAVFASQDLITW
jgi:hypothetical protein